MPLPSKEEWAQVQAEMERRRMQQEAQLRQQQVQTQLEAELARQQAAWNSMQGKAWRVTGISGPIQGKTATVTVCDDSYEDIWNQMEYKDVARHMRNALARITTVRKDMETMRDWRYRSPYHPKRWIRWLQKHRKPILDTLIFGPLVVVALWLAGWAYIRLAGATDYYVATVTFWVPIAVAYGIHRKVAMK